MTDLLQIVDAPARALAAWLTWANTQTLILLAAAIAADVLFARRISAAWRIFLYIPVFTRLVVPPQFAWTVPFWTTAEPTISVSISGSAQASFSAAEPAITPATPTPAFGTPHLVLAVYLSGLLALIAVQIRAARKLANTLKAATSSAPGVWTAPNAGPMVAGIFAPRIIIPSWLESSPALPLILSHERAHIARRDPAVSFVLRVACTLAWPVLPLWIAASRVRALMELACDDHALGTPEHRRQETLMQYANAMIDVAERSTVAPGALGFGAALRSRITALRTPRRWPAAIQAVAACALPAALFACSAARPESSAITPAPIAAAGAIAPKAPAKPSADPLADARSVRVLIVDGYVDVAGLATNLVKPEFVVLSREPFLESFYRSPEQTIATPRLLVNPGQQAAISVGSGTSSMSLELTVRPSAPGTLDAAVTFSDADDYRLPETMIRIRQDETAVICLPSRAIGLPPRTLIFILDRPGEGSDAGC